MQSVADMLQKRALLSDQPFLPDVLSDATFVTKNIIATPMKIGFLGLGMMGSGMVDNLLRSGHEVTVWNRTSSKVRYHCLGIFVACKKVVLEFDCTFIWLFVDFIIC